MEDARLTRGRFLGSVGFLVLLHCLPRALVEDGAAAIGAAPSDAYASRKVERKMITKAPY